MVLSLPGSQVLGDSNIIFVIPFLFLRLVIFRIWGNFYMVIFRISGNLVRSITYKIIFRVGENLMRNVAVWPACMSAGFSWYVSMKLMSSMETRC